MPFHPFGEALMMYSKYDEAQFHLRLPHELHAKIKQRAKMNNRSLNSEIVQILEDALSSDVSSVDKSLDLKQIKSLLDKISNELLDRIPKDT